MKKTIDDKEVGKRARSRRKELGLTQKEAQVLLGWGSPGVNDHVSNFERGKVVTIPKCEDIARVYDISLGWLLLGEIPIEEQVQKAPVDKIIKETEDLVLFLVNERLPFLWHMKAIQDDAREEYPKYMKERGWDFPDLGKGMYLNIIDAGSKEALKRYLREEERTAAYVIKHHDPDEVDNALEKSSYQNAAFLRIKR